jgi:predicted transcriptional regulator
VKTTVELPDDLLREARQLARAEGTTFKSLMEEGLRAVVGRRRESGRFALEDASVGGRGLRPEFAGADWSRIRDAAYGGRL